MRQLLGILMLIACVTKAQVAAPQLHCLEVINSSGDVKLNWLAPADPNNQFAGYDIYFSATKGGNYSPVATGIGPIGTTSFVHSTTITTVQSGFYYMVTRYGLNGSVSSISSDTLRTIFLNIITSASDALRLTFNHVHNPPLASSSTTFLIRQEYPPGVWKDLVTTPLEFYNDTFNICNSINAKINYVVSITDKAGCTSVSNIQGGVYHDLHVPYMPTMDSISVLPNGNTIIAWRVPIDKDVVQYEIQKKQGGTNVPIDHVPGRLSTSYLLGNTAAVDGTVGLYVKAIDSCNGGSVVDYEPLTMHLNVKYNKCSFQTELRWNHYRWIVNNGKPTEELLEYRIYYSVDSGATFKRLDATKDSSYLHSGVDPGKNIMYFIRVANKRQTMTASSNRRNFYSGEVAAPKFLYIRTASVIKKNVIQVQIYIDAEQASRGIELERSQDGLEYQNIAFMPFSGTPYYSFDDEKVETGKRFYYYRCLVRDSCGNIRQTSNVARTVLLTVKEDKENIFAKHLSWTQYLGFNGNVKEYSIYRIVQDINSFELVGRTDSATTTFSDNIEFAAPLGARIEYMVEAFEGYGNIFLIEEKSYSNSEPVYMEGRIFVPNAFAPNGHNKRWKPVTHFVDKREYGVTVFNRWGETVFSAGNDVDEWNGDGCPSGVYIYLITYKNSRGEYQEVKGDVTLIR